MNWLNDHIAFLSSIEIFSHSGFYLQSVIISFALILFCNFNYRIFVTYIELLEIDSKYFDKKHIKYISLMEIVLCLIPVVNILYGFGRMSNNTVDGKLFKYYIKSPLYGPRYTPE